MREALSQDAVVLDPKHWKVWVLLGLLGIVASVITGLFFGIGPVDVLLLHPNAFPIFTIVDYVLIAYGIVQLGRFVRGRKAAHAP